MRNSTVHTSTFNHTIPIAQSFWMCYIAVHVKKLIDMDTTLTIRIDKELEQLLEESSKRTGQSKSELVRQALKRQLRIESFQQLRKELLPYGEAQGWLTDEDVFREVS
ncbi:type II toxin-antitoxin system VapB family antitoxin [Rhodohalobacter sp. SW132]|uniref:ribbon-helix-helix protein, CopG family n=1 Tax=Rhodohalobacter sp. SW132 TaxID=2293433 RepID=UPI0018F5ABCF|nr:type II toxin-antitoxin system VapB family antitoxin [Rhodohalobacter sp. SW132]